MDLVVFDLDGTLLNAGHSISPRTGRALVELAERGIAFTVATGRSLHSARDVLDGHAFRLPQVFRNGVMTWNPATKILLRHNCLTLAEIEHVITAILAQDVSPFIATIEPGDCRDDRYDNRHDNRHCIYHPPVTRDIERGLADYYVRSGSLDVRPLAELPADADIVGISAIGKRLSIDRIAALIEPEKHLIAYAGTALQGRDWRWIDIHHVEASKGNAITRLRKELGATSVLCFGDGLNDLSMFAVADESFAPASAGDDIKSAAGTVIGHHDEDGVANYLAWRYSLSID
ncbi:MAG: HAD-IIB family hydrolase [Wenzhouxiangella sp.]|jgi:hydroxymethylpyrimidine pyrophosphatase-like HAD family hydrolase|nr:HAD-IIB family hydrolase [Wenzhouxiangella sp.]